MTTSKFNKCTSCLWLSQTDLLSQCLPFSFVSTHRKSAVGRIYRTCTFLRFFYELERFQKCSKPWTKIRLFQKFWRTSETVKIFRRILIFTETVNVLTPRLTKAVKIFSRILNFMEVMKIFSWIPKLAMKIFAIIFANSKIYRNSGNI